jgi:hypothetical protein
VGSLILGVDCGCESFGSRQVKLANGLNFSILGLQTSSGFAEYQVCNEDGGS